LSGRPIVKSKAPILVHFAKSLNFTVEKDSFSSKLRKEKGKRHYPSSKKSIQKGSSCYSTYVRLPVYHSYFNNNEIVT
jgi:hypothetical protein